MSKKTIFYEGLKFDGSYTYTQYNNAIIARKAASTSYLVNLIFYRQLLIGVDPSDDNYTPYRVIVNGIAENGQLMQLNDMCIEL